MPTFPNSRNQSLGDGAGQLQSLVWEGSQPGMADQGTITDSDMADMGDCRSTAVNAIAVVVLVWITRGYVVSAKRQADAAESQAKAAAAQAAAHKHRQCGVGYSQSIKAGDL